VTAPSAEAAREHAREVLSRSDYHRHDPPRPLRGVLEWLGDRLRPLERPFVDAWQWIVDDRSRYLPFAVLVVAGAIALTVVLGRRRAAFAGHDRDQRVRVDREDPDALERLAEERERAGDLDQAVRLRFRAGLLRLDIAGALSYRPSLTAGAATRAVDAPSLPALASSFDEIAYGGRTASPDDVAAARTGWPRVLQEVRT
jgi:hypothetical protein